MKRGDDLAVGFSELNQIVINSVLRSLEMPKTAREICKQMFSGLSPKYKHHKMLLERSVQIIRHETNRVAHCRVIAMSSNVRPRDYGRTLYMLVGRVQKKTLSAVGVRHVAIVGIANHLLGKTPAPKRPIHVQVLVVLQAETRGCVTGVIRRVT